MQNEDNWREKIGKKFLFSMCQVVGVHFIWFDDNAFDHMSEDAVEEYIEHFKRDVPSIMVIIK